MADLQSLVFSLFFSDSSELHDHITLGEELRGFLFLIPFFPFYFP